MIQKTNLPKPPANKLEITIGYLFKFFEIYEVPDGSAIIIDGFKSEIRPKVAKTWAMILYDHELNEEEFLHKLGDYFNFGQIIKDDGVWGYSVLDRINRNVSMFKA